MNVTLGVPRLKEVINVAKTIKTPSLKIFLKKEIELSQADAMRVGDQIQYANLSHLVSDWGIYYDPNPVETIIKDDQELIQIWREAGDLMEEAENDADSRLSKWVLRFKMNNDPQTSIFSDYFRF